MLCSSVSFEPSRSLDLHSFHTFSPKVTIVQACLREVVVGVLAWMTPGHNWTERSLLSQALLTYCHTTSHSRKIKSPIFCLLSRNSNTKSQSPTTGSDLFIAFSFKPIFILYYSALTTFIIFSQLTAASKLRMKKDIKPRQ